MSQNSRFFAPISEAIWDMKYRYKDPDGTARDQTVEDTWHRIAKDLASVEAEPEVWEERFYRALEDFRFLLLLGRHLGEEGAEGVG